MLVKEFERDGKTFEVRSGTAGDGQPIFVVQTIREGRCLAIDRFEKLDEAERWAEFA